MRTFILVCVVALLVAGGVAYAVGLVDVVTEHSSDRCVVSLIINTAMLQHPARVNSAAGTEAADDGFLDIKGKVTAVRPELNEVLVSENVKNWKFKLAKDGKVFINERESRLAELQAGDDATVTFDRQRDLLIASVIRCTRNK